MFMRFRQEQIGFMVPIESMSYQVRIPELQTEDQWPKKPSIQTALDADPDVRNRSPYSHIK